MVVAGLGAKNAPCYSLSLFWTFSRLISLFLWKMFPFHSFTTVRSTGFLLFWDFDMKLWLTEIWMLIASLWICLTLGFNFKVWCRWSWTISQRPIGSVFQRVWVRFFDVVIGVVEMVAAVGLKSDLCFLFSGHAIVTSLEERNRKKEKVISGSFWPPQKWFNSF